MASLMCLPPTVEPRVSQSIPAIIALTQTIIDRDHAYAVDGAGRLSINASCEELV